MTHDSNQRYDDHRSPEALHHVNHKLWLSLGFFIIFLLACGAAMAGVTLYAHMANTGPAPIPYPTLPSTQKPIVSSTLSAPDNNLIQLTVQRYYEAIKQGDYDTAYNTCFDPSGSIAGQSASISLLTRLNAQKDVILSYTTTGILKYFDANGITTADVTVRIKRNGDPEYNVELILKRNGNNWKITSADDI